MTVEKWTSCHLLHNGCTSYSAYFYPVTQTGYSLVSRVRRSNLMVSINESSSMADIFKCYQRLRVGVSTVAEEIVACQAFRSFRSLFVQSRFATPQSPWESMTEQDRKRLRASFEAYLQLPVNLEPHLGEALARVLQIMAASSVRRLFLRYLARMGCRRPTRPICRSGSRVSLGSEYFLARRLARTKRRRAKPIHR